MPDHPPVLLEVCDLYKSFGGVRAVLGCSFVVQQGTVTGLIGPNGAGKSTVIELVAGFQRPDAGVVRFLGHEIQGWPAFRLARRGLMRTFQTSREWPRLTVMENVLVAVTPVEREGIWAPLLTPGVLRHAEESDRVRAREGLDQVGLLSLRDELAGNLSGGQKRLLEIARIFLARPRLVLLDEPLTGVNPVLGAQIGLAIKSLVSEGMTVLMVEHNLPFVERMCNTVVVMSLGQAIATGPLHALRADPAVVDAYLGQVAANV